MYYSADTRGAHPTRALTEPDIQDHAGQDSYVPAQKALQIARRPPDRSPKTYLFFDNLRHI